MFYGWAKDPEPVRARMLPLRAVSGCLPNVVSGKNTSAKSFPFVRVSVENVILEFLDKCSIRTALVLGL